MEAASATTPSRAEQADLRGQPTRIDYPAQIKRWQVLAEQAEQLARRWEQRR